MNSVGTQTDLRDLSWRKLQDTTDLTNSTGDRDDDTESEYNLEVYQTLGQKVQQCEDHFWQKRQSEVNSITIR